MRSQHFCVVVRAALGLFAAMTAGAQAWDANALRSFAGLTPDQWRAVENGAVEAQVLDTQEKREVAIVGATHLRATTECFLSRFQDIENFKKNPAVLRIGKFSLPPDSKALAGFALEARDLADLAACRMGNCKVKLPAGAIQRLSREVGWSQPGWEVRAQSVLREELESYLHTYSREGNVALMEYRDRDKPLRLAREFQGVLDARPGLAGFVPKFHEYLAQYPREPLAGVSEFFYWSVENFGLKPVASITHVSVYAQPGRVVTASRQIYASHYFDASLGLAAALDDQSNPSEPGMYLVYLNRSRIDLLGGFFGGLRRTLVRGRLRDGMRKNLEEVVHRLESACSERRKASRKARPSRYAPT